MPERYRRTSRRNLSPEESPILTEGARDAFRKAEQEARNGNQDHIDTRHILLGLLKDKDNLATRVLLGLGIDFGRLRHQVEVLISENHETQDPELTEKVIRISIEEAESLNHHYIVSEHILLGLIKAGGAAAQALESEGVDYEKTISAIIVF